MFSLVIQVVRFCKTFPFQLRQKMWDRAEKQRDRQNEMERLRKRGRTNIISVRYRGTECVTSQRERERYETSTWFFSAEMLKLCLSLSNNRSCHSGREIGQRDRERERGGECNRLRKRRGRQHVTGFQQTWGMNTLAEHALTYR